MVVHFRMSLTLADLSMVYERPLWTMSFSLAPAMRVLNISDGVMGMPLPWRPNFLSRLSCTLSVKKESGGKYVLLKKSCLYLQ